MIKPEVVLDAEAEMSEVGRLLDFPQHHETLQNFYNLLKFLKSRQRRLKFMNRVFSSVFVRMVTAAGASTHMRADRILLKTRHSYLPLKSIPYSVQEEKRKAGHLSI